MGSGFRTLFGAFVALGMSRPRDTLHATLLATSLAIVRASLVGDSPFSSQFDATALEEAGHPCRRSRAFQSECACGTCGKQ